MWTHWPLSSFLKIPDYSYTMERWPSTKLDQRWQNYAFANCTIRANCCISEVTETKQFPCQSSAPFHHTRACSQEEPTCIMCHTLNTRQCECSSIVSSKLVLLSSLLWLARVATQRFFPLLLKSELARGRSRRVLWWPETSHEAQLPSTFSEWKLSSHCCGLMVTYASGQEKSERH